MNFYYTSLYVDNICHLSRLYRLNHHWKLCLKELLQLVRGGHLRGVSAHGVLGQGGGLRGRPAHQGKALQGGLRDRGRRAVDLSWTSIGLHTHIVYDMI